MTIAELLTAIFGPLGALAALVVAVIAFARGWVVPGWLYRREMERANDAERRAWRIATGIAEPAVRTAEKLAADK